MRLILHLFQRVLTAIQYNYSVQVFFSLIPILL